MPHGRKVHPKKEVWGFKGQSTQAGRGKSIKPEVCWVWDSVSVRSDVIWRVGPSMHRIWYEWSYCQYFFANYQHLPTSTVCEYWVKAIRNGCPLQCWSLMFHLRALRASPYVCRTSQTGQTWGNLIGTETVRNTKLHLQIFTVKSSMWNWLMVASYHDYWHYSIHYIYNIYLLTSTDQRNCWSYLVMLSCSVVIKCPCAGFASRQPMSLVIACSPKVVKLSYL